LLDGHQQQTQDILYQYDMHQSELEEEQLFLMHQKQHQQQVGQRQQPQQQQQQQKSAVIVVMIVIINAPALCLMFINTVKQNYHLLLVLYKKENQYQMTRMDVNNGINVKNKNISRRNDINRGSNFSSNGRSRSNHHYHYALITVMIVEPKMKILMMY
jgi:hypothetical protein